VYHPSRHLLAAHEARLAVKRRTGSDVRTARCAIVISPERRTELADGAAELTGPLELTDGDDDSRSRGCYAIVSVSSVLCRSRAIAAAPAGLRCNPSLANQDGWLRE
jgi:hypothetical protein